MIARNIFRSRQMILLYHRIAPVESDPWSLCVTPEHFAEHVEVLRRYRPIKFTQTRSLRRIFDRGDFSVAITFDDGYADNFYQAAPLLERYEIPASFFIATSYVGTAREFWWDELEKLVFQTAPWLGAVELTASGRTRVFQMDCDSGRMPLYLSLYEFLQPLTHEARLDVMDRLLQCSGQITAVRPSHRVMTRDELIKLAGAGLFEIGAHTVTHPKLSTQSIATQQTEILGSKTWLEELLGKSIISFSYPYGGMDHFTEATVELVRNAGFSYACTNAARYVKWIDAPLELPRFNITDMNGEEFEKRLFY